LDSDLDLTIGDGLRGYCGDLIDDTAIGHLDLAYLAPVYEQSQRASRIDTADHAEAI
jgi:hypothetical protein